MSNATPSERPASTAYGQPGSRQSANVPQDRDALYGEIRRLRKENAELARQLAEARICSRNDREARRAALNLIEDAEQARRAEQAENIERRRVEEELRQANCRKDEFLAMLAHELRNPLAPIRTMLGILTERVDRALIPDLRMIEEQIDYIVRLVDDLLDVTRIALGKIELRVEPLALDPIINRAVEVARPQLDQRKIDVSLPANPIYVHGDRVRLTQVISNLLNNATKFTNPGGQIWLTLEVESDAAAIKVRDNGIGLAADQCGRVFDMFTQVDSSWKRSHGGLGLGLTLVKKIVELHGGKVAAHSGGLGRGAEFAIHLPTIGATELESTANRPASAECGANELDGRIILVVDDNREAARALAKLLELRGCKVHVRYDGADAVAAAEQLRPELVLMDIGMPGMDGYEACAKIRQQDGGKEIILVALTGWGQDADIRRAIDKGFDAHVVKPAKPSELHELLGTLLKVQSL
jgi:signal transduction histidine kinase/CheY-like chemotaxis protein